MRPSGLAALCALSLCTSSVRATSAPPDAEARVRAYVRSLSEGKAWSLEDLQGGKIVLDLSQGMRPTRAYVENLEREVAGRPDHPKRVELEAAKRQLASGNCWRVTLWCDGPQWRMTERGGCADDSAIRTVAGVTPSEVWFISANVMSVRSLGVESPPGMKYEALAPSQALANLNALRDVGVAKCPDAREFAIEFHDASRWSAKRPSFNSPGAFYVLEGSWDEHFGMPLIRESYTVNDRGERMIESSEVSFDEWGYWGPKREWMPRVSETRRGGSDRSQRELVAWDPVDAQTLALAWMRPGPRGTDMELGVYALKEVREVGAEPEAPKDVPPEFQHLAQQARALQQSTWWTWWVVAALVGVSVAVAGGVIWKRRSRPRRRIHFTRSGT